MNFSSALIQLLFSPSVLLISLVIFLITIIKRRNARQREDYWVKRNILYGEMASLSKTLSGANVPARDEAMVKKYGKLFGTHKLGEPTIMCADPELASKILTKDFIIFKNRRELHFNDDLIDNGLNMVSDDQWKRIRSIVTPTFSSGKLRKMRPIIDECVQSLVNDFNRLIDENSEMDMKRVFGAFTMNVLTSVAFGIKVDSLIDQNNPIIVNAKQMLSRDFKLLDIPKLLLITKFPRIAKLFNLKFISPKVTEFFADLTKKIIDERKANTTKTKRYDFLQLLLDAMEIEEKSDDLKVEKNIDNDSELFEEHKFITHNKTISITEITAQCTLFFMAGYDTTAATLSFASYNLACNQEVQQKLYEEAKSVLESQSELDDDLLLTLKYTDAVLSESLRLYPPGASLERTASEDYNLDGDVTIFKGDIINIPIYAMQRDAQYFSEPQSFKPERFFPENRSHHPYAYLPFGAGPRNCVAKRLALLEAKLALLYSVYHFRFICTDNTEHPPKTYNNGGLLIPRQILLRVEKR